MGAVSIKVSAASNLEEETLFFEIIQNITYQVTANTFGGFELIFGHKYISLIKPIKT